MGGAVAFDGEVDGGFRGEDADLVFEGGGRADGVAIDGGDEIIGFEGGFVCGGIWDDEFDAGARERIEEELIEGGVGGGLEPDAEKSLGGGAIGDDLVGDVFEGIAWDGEADPFDVSLDGAVDEADNFAVHVEERAAGVARIYGGICLEIAFDWVEIEIVSLFCANNAHRGSRFEEGISGLGFVGVGEIEVGEGNIFGIFDFEDSDVGSRVGADEGGFEDPGVGKLDGDEDAGGVFDDVVVGGDVAVGGDEKSGALFE